MGNNFKPQSLARRRFSGLPGPFGQGRHVDSFSVARVRPRTSKGITDLLLLNLVRLEAACPSKKIILYVGSKNHLIRKPRAFQDTKIRLFSRLESRSLSELTRQIAPPTKNGHAPPPTESRKSYQSVNPSGVRAW
ncbi:hypothetical protein KQX54_005865 [Cotesia glomerata]|uniref:Uncharacterized protein n=1 Tax=Cotesia glomerata TaxID=32391 RepID=A0AAV7IMH5_COTGL|nr:hypothetical protein KQX54_005865 [Cotesia glomerata]